MYLMSKTWGTPIGKLSRSSRERGQNYKMNELWFTDILELAATSKR